MLPVAYAVQSEVTSPKFAMHFARGCGGTAIPADATTTLHPGPAAFFGSMTIWPLIQQAMADPNRDAYYADHAYFRRHRYYRITKNRYQHTGIPTPGQQLSTQRLRECGVDMQPEWHRDGTHIVVCPNSPRYMAGFGIDAHTWAGDIVRDLLAYTDRPVIVRWKAQAAKRPLYVDLVDAWCVIVFSSNAAVEGLAAGIPCITLADFAASRRMGRDALSDIENPYYPDRQDVEDFLCTLAHNQWTMQEIERGEAWKVLRTT